THSFWHLEVQLPWLLLEPLAAARRGNVIAASPVASIAARFILEVVAIGAGGSSKTGAARQGRNGSGPPHAPATRRQPACRGAWWAPGPRGAPPCGRARYSAA